MLGKISLGMSVSQKAKYVISVLSNDIGHDFKYAKYLAEKLGCSNVEANPYRSGVRDISAYFTNKYAAEKYARLIRASHLFDEKFKCQ